MELIATRGQYVLFLFKLLMTLWGVLYILSRAIEVGSPNFGLVAPLDLCHR